MSDKFDIRLRRKQFTEGRIERFKNYESLMQRHKNSSRRRARGIAIVVFIIILALVLFFSTVSISNKNTSYSKQLPDKEIQSEGPKSLNI